MLLYDGYNERLLLYRSSSTADTARTLIGWVLVFFALLFACVRVRVRNYMEVLVSAYDNGGRVRVRIYILLIVLINIIPLGATVTEQWRFLSALEL